MVVRVRKEKRKRDDEVDNNFCELPLPFSKSQKKTQMIFISLLTIGSVTAWHAEYDTCTGIQKDEEC